MIAMLEPFHFLRPWWLLGLIPTMLLAWQMHRRRKTDVGLEREIAPHLLRALTVSPTRKPQQRAEMWAVPLWIIAVLALAGPAWKRERPPWADDQSSLYFVARMTPSMNSEDLQPTRLERARSKLHDLMQARGGGETGLIAYSGSAHLVMPATEDAGVIDQMLQSLDPDIMPGEGDALAEALAIASEHIDLMDGNGSILIVADACEPAVVPELITWRSQSNVAVQWMAPLPIGSELPALGIADAAGAIDARVQVLTPDDSDVTAMVAGAARSFASGRSDDSVQFRDEGVWLVWPLGLGLAFWFRKGWSVQA